MSAKRKFSDHALLTFIRDNQRVVTIGPSIKACARRFGVAYQSMGERLSKLKPDLVTSDDNGVHLTASGLNVTMIREDILNGG